MCIKSTITHLYRYNAQRSLCRCGFTFATTFLLLSFLIQTKANSSSSLSLSSSWSRSISFFPNDTSSISRYTNQQQRSDNDFSNTLFLKTPLSLLQYYHNDRSNRILNVRSLAFNTISSLRGGANELDDYDDYDFTEDDENLEEFDFDLDAADLDSVDDDFQEDSTLGRAWDGFQKSPPLTKFYLSSSFAATAIGYITNKNEFPPILLLDWKATTTRLQIWRPVTAFLNFGPLSLGYLMTSHFVWTYMATLEKLNHETPYEFWWMMLFGCTSMILGYGILNISPRFLGHNLSTFFVYVWSRYHEGLQVSMFDLFQTRAETLPWFFLAQTFLLEGEVPILDLLGIVFGHVYHYGRSVGIGKAPKFVRYWYEKGEGELAQSIRAEYKKVASDFELQ